MIKYNLVIIAILAGCAPSTPKATPSSIDNNNILQMTIKGCERDWKMLGYTSANDCIEQHNDLLGIS